MPQLAGPTDPAADARWPDVQARKGFFTDTSICIGCKACEVACKEWNGNPRDGNLELLGSSYDNTGALGASTWRHVAFIEQGRERIEEARASGRALVDLGMPTVGAPGQAGPAAPASGAAPAGSAEVTPAEGASVEGASVEGASVEGASVEGASVEGALHPDTPEFRWLMASDVCKHCTHAGCLDVCPTGALFRTEFGTVVVQADVCNGCGTCVAGCPFGVVERRTDGTAGPRHDRDKHDRGKPGRGGHGERKGEQPEVPNLNVAQKCTLCYDRLLDDQVPACAQTCPTTSIKFGDHADMADQARARVAELHAQGRTEARLYGVNDRDGVGGTGSVFLLLDEPEAYGLPPDPRVATADLPRMYQRAGMAAAGMAAAAVVAFLGSRR